MYAFCFSASFFFPSEIYNSKYCPFEVCIAEELADVCCPSLTTFCSSSVKGPEELEFFGVKISKLNEQEVSKSVLY